MTGSIFNLINTISIPIIYQVCFIICYWICKALFDCYTQINEYLETIDSQRKTIAFQQESLDGNDTAYAIYYDRIIEWQELIKKISKENKEVWQQRNDAIRSYNGLIEMGKTAKQLGVDTSSWKLPEEEKDKFKDYKFSIDHKVLESGKVQYAAKLTKRKNNDE